MKKTVSRRNWLKKLSAGVAGLAVAEASFGRSGNNKESNAFDYDRALIDPKDDLKITQLEIIPVNSLRTIFIKLHTNAGIIGIGEGTVEGRITTTMAAIKELESYLIGKDPRRPAHHWQAMYRHAFYRGGIVLTSALSAVDIAMWDIKGKALGVPIYELLGGPTRDRIRLYGQAGSPEGAKDVLAEGYQSMKISVTSSRGRLSRYGENPDFIQGIVENIKAIRSNAKKYGIDPAKIGAMGFSAGAHVVARLEMKDSLQSYPSQDAADAVSDKPNALIIIYPGYLSDGPNRSLSPELKATDKTADTFIFQTMDDGSALSSLALGRALQEAKASVELHMLPKGGHGYGMYPGNKAAETWPGLLESWLKEHL